VADLYTHWPRWNIVGVIVRYETNIIYPPMYAGTVHVSPLTSTDDIIGGAFEANTEGLAHYAKFGYKCRCDKD
jgi:hypothetical protein